MTQKLFCEREKLASGWELEKTKIQSEGGNKKKSVKALLQEIKRLSC